MPVVSGGGSGGTASNSLIFYDEGNIAGTATKVNVTGSGGTVSVSGGTAVIDVSAAAGGVTVQEVDGSPSGTATAFVFTNGSLSFSNGTATVSTTATALAGTAYKRTTGNYTTSGTVFADVDSTNMALTITTGARRVLLGLSGACQSGAAGDVIAFDFLVDGTAVGGTATGLWASWMPSTANRRVNVSATFLTDPLSAGEHTFKVQWKRALGSGTATLFGDLADAVSQFYAIEQGA